MLFDTDGDDWIFRRDHWIRGPLSAMGHVRNTLPYLAPEIQLLYKSKQSRPRDEADLSSALPAMSADQIDWLLDALRLHDPGNPWIPEISAHRCA